MEKTPCYESIPDRLTALEAALNASAMRTNELLARLEAGEYIGTGDKILDDWAASVPRRIARSDLTERRTGEPCQ